MTTCVIIVCCSLGVPAPGAMLNSVKWAECQSFALSDISCDLGGQWVEEDEWQVPAHSEDGVQTLNPWKVVTVWGNCNAGAPWELRQTLTRAGPGA